MASQLLQWAWKACTWGCLYFVLLIVYRLTLHPLARSRIPGPKLAAATYWYSFYQDLIAKPGPGHEVYHFAQLHDLYGPVVRVSPDEVHVRDSSWVDTLYAQGRRDKWLRNHKANGSPGSITQTASGELHRRRRAPLTPFFSRQAVMELESSIAAKVNHWSTRIESEYLGRDLDIGASMTALTLDVITEYCFGQSWRCLSAPDFDPGWKTTMNKLFQPVPLMKQFPWLLQCLNSPPPGVTSVLAPDMTRMLEAKKQVSLQVERILNEHHEGKLPVLSKEIRGKTVFESILAGSLPPHDKTARRLTDEGFPLVVAGAETTAKTLTNTLFYLLDDPGWLSRVRSELEGVMPVPDQLPTWSTLENLQCLSATVKESMRLGNLVANRLQLIDPSSDLICNNIRIPRGSPVSMSIMDVHFDAKIFSEPFNFHPERWLGESGKKLARYYMPFHKGTRSCIGQNLAYCEIFLALAAILRRLEFRLVAGSSRSQIESIRDCFIGMPAVDAKPLMLEIVDTRK